MSCTSKKVTWGDVLAIERMPDKIVWLEEGLDDAQALAKYGKEDFGRGFRHILEDHEADFLRQNISKSEIKDVVMQALRENNVVGKQGDTRFVYFTNYKGRDYAIAIEIGSNGFIVGANPKHLEDYIK